MGRKPSRRCLSGKRGRGIIQDDKCPVLGLVRGTYQIDSLSQCSTKNNQTYCQNNDY